MSETLVTESETQLAVEQKEKLVKTLGLFDTIFFIVATIVTLDLIGQAASNGFEAFTWTIVLTILFLIPYGLVMAEIGSGFPLEGGPYEWVKLSFGRFWSAINTMFYWVTNPLWIGGSLAFIGTEAFSSGITTIADGSFWDYLFKFVFIWVSISTAIVSLKIGKWIPTLGAMCKVGLVGFFAITVIVYGIKNGFQPVKFGDFKPTSTGLLAIAPLLLFSFVGFESANGAAEEMKDPQKDVPKSILVSGLLSAFCYITPILLVLLVIPLDKITGLGGFLDAVKESYTIYGGAADFMFGVTALLFIFTLINSGSAWMISGDRTIAIASADGAFFPYFGEFSEKLGTPLRANILSGVTATIFMVASVLLLSSGSADIFGVVLTIAVSTTLISYLLMFPAAWALRRKYDGVHRPYRIPGKDNRYLIGCVILIEGWIMLGSWTAVFPGSLDKLLGNEYSFTENWGVSWATFEVFTLGTLAVIVAVSLIGYAAGAGVRSQTVTVPVGEPEPGGS
jgi:amino acid transporter